jgi:hypothetical protein
MAALVVRRESAPDSSNPQPSIGTGTEATCF